MQVLSRAATIVHPSTLLRWVRTVAINQCLLRLSSPWPSRLEGEDRMGGISDIERMLTRPAARNAHGCVATRRRGL